MLLICIALISVKVKIMTFEETPSSAHQCRTASDPGMFLLGMKEQTDFRQSISGYNMGVNSMSSLEFKIFQPLFLD